MVHSIIYHKERSQHISKGGASLKHLTQDQQNRILWELKTSGGNLPRSMIARRTKLKQTELESILEELEREGTIKRTRLRTGGNGHPKELIALKV
jgi:DNA-binding HxlR family transcriptional regulator